MFSEAVLGQILPVDDAENGILLSATLQFLSVDRAQVMLKIPGQVSASLRTLEAQIFFAGPQVSTTVETFQDLSLPIPGKEDLAKLHSAIYQNVPAKTGACGDNYASQGWIAFIMEYIRRCVSLESPCAVPHLPWLCTHQLLEGSYP